MAPHRPLDPAVARIVEALADLMVDRDITRLRVGVMPPPMTETHVRSQRRAA